MRLQHAAILIAGLLCGNVVSTCADEEIRLAADPALSPNGSEVAFSWRGDIWIAPATGGTVRQLTSHPGRDSQPAFSPDGQHLAFVSNRTGDSQLYRMELPSGEPVQLTYHSEGYSLEEWYPDGQALLANGQRDHFWRHADRFFRVGLEPRTSETLLFDAHGENGTLSPDGKKLLFTREGTRWWRKQYRGSQASQVWMRDMETGEFREVASHETGCRSPMWNADGSAFYYLDGRSGAMNLWLQDMSGGEPRQLTEFDDDSVVYPAISRDGSVVVFRHLFDLYRWETDGSRGPRKIRFTYQGDQFREPYQFRTLTSTSQASFSADGLEVAFVAGGDVWVMDTELREPRQVTSTPEEERDVVFAPDGSALLFVSDAEGQSDIWRAVRGDEESYWWQNESFPLTRLTEDAAVESNLSFSPDGSQVAFVKERGDLWLMQPDGKRQRRLFRSWNSPDYDWSPDGKWLVYSLSDQYFNRDVFVLPLDGSREPFNISSHPDNETDPAWSPDGRTIAFVGRRQGTETDIYLVPLTAEFSEETSRDRRLQEALKKMQQGRRDGGGKPDNGTEDEESDDDETDEGGEDEEEAEAEEDDEEMTVRIDFEGLHDRIRRVAIVNVDESGLFWSPDSQKLAFTATINGQRGTYSISPPDDLSAKLLSNQTGTGARWLKKGKQIVWVSNGTPASLTADGRPTPYPFSVRQRLDVAARYEAAFMQCWRTMRDNFYDPALNNRNWNAVYRKYAGLARNAVDDAAFSEVVSLMLGELNGSHLGFFTLSSRGGGASDSWREVTPHLGVRFDPDYNGPGMRVRDVIRGGPADRAASRIEPGEIIVSVDGQNLDPDMDLPTALNGVLERDMRLQVRDEEGNDREVVLRPISYGAARALLYEQWVRHNRARVDELSGGRLAYLHIRGMNMTSFYRFERELFEVAGDRDGIVIDVRENGGGSTTDHLLTILTQPEHAITIPRGGEPGYPHDRRVYATWSKPIIVLCNQNSFSNAEIFSHAIKTLDRGQVVGVPTAGGVISTGGRSILDLGFIRMPFRAWFVLETGEDMELNGAVPDHIIWPEPGDWPAGRDAQLDKAIEVLSADVEAWQARPRPELRYASER